MRRVCPRVRPGADLRHRAGHDEAVTEPTGRDQHPPDDEKVRRITLAIDDYLMSGQQGLLLLTGSNATGKSVILNALRLMWRQTVEAAYAPGVTGADLQALAVELQTALREVERQRAAAVASAESHGPALATHRWTVVGSLAAILGVLIALLALVQDRIEADRPDPPPSVTVVVRQPDPAEIERIVDERLRQRGIAPAA